MIDNGNIDPRKMSMMHLHSATQAGMFKCFFYPRQTIGVKSSNEQLALTEWGTARHQCPHPFFCVPTCAKHGLSTRGRGESYTPRLTQCTQLGNDGIGTLVHEHPFVQNHATELHFLAHRIKCGRKTCLIGPIVKERISAGTFLCQTKGEELVARHDLTRKSRLRIVEYILPCFRFSNQRRTTSAKL